MSGHRLSPNRRRDVGERLAANFPMIPANVPQGPIWQRIVTPRTQWWGSWEFKGLAERDEDGVWGVTAEGWLGLTCHQPSAVLWCQGLRRSGGGSPWW